MPTESESPTPAPDTPAPSPTIQPELEPPDRDLFDLARRFRGLPSDTPRLARQTPYGYEVGASEVFSLVNLDVPETIEISATVRAITEHAYFFVQDGIGFSQGNLNRASEDFEEIVYPTVTGAFGREWTPGIDSDPRITILHADLRGAAGYVSGGDSYPTAVVPDSNEREMMYIYADALGAPGVPYNALVAHEFQHVIHEQADEDEDSWVNEGLSEVAAGLVGGGYNTVDLFLNSPDTQLTFWPELESSPVHYAAAELFMGYVLDRYGGRQNAVKLAGTAGDSIDGVDAYLEGFGVDFKDVFADWLIANYLDEAEGPYAHAEINRGVTLPTTIGRDGAGEGSVHQFAADYLPVEPPVAPAVFTFDGGDEVSIGIPALDGPFWWSDRGDGIDSRLTHEFDLTGVAGATLEFSTWFDIEEGWDYAYVAASTDGGATWRALPGRHTTDYDSVEASYGPGFTGNSGGWLKEQIDLSPYAGEKVLLRFEYVTDGATSLTGFAVDNVAIPELGYADGGSGEGWVREGFSRIDGPARQEFIVQVVEGFPVQVRRVPLDATNRAEIVLNGTAKIVIAAITEGTTEVAPYSWSLARR